MTVNDERHAAHRIGEESWLTPRIYDHWLEFIAQAGGGVSPPLSVYVSSYTTPAGSALTQANFEAALRAAIADVPNAGGGASVAVVMPEGQWTLSAGFELRSLGGGAGTWLRGQGKGATTLLFPPGLTGAAIGLRGDLNYDGTPSAVNFFIGGLSDFKILSSGANAVGIDCVNLLLSTFSNVGSQGFSGATNTVVTGATVSGQTTLTGVASIAGLAVGQPVSVAGAFAAGTVITAIAGSGPYALTMSAAAGVTSAASAVTLVTSCGIAWRLRQLGGQLAQTNDFYLCDGDTSGTGWEIGNINTTHFQSCNSNQNIYHGIVVNPSTQVSFGGRCLLQSHVFDQIEIQNGAALVRITDCQCEGSPNSLVKARLGTGGSFAVNVSRVTFTSLPASIVDCVGDLGSVVTVEDCVATGGTVPAFKARGMGNLRAFGSRGDADIALLDLDDYSRMNAVSIQEGSVRTGNRSSGKTLTGVLQPYAKDIFDVAKFASLSLTGTDFNSATGLNGGAINLINGFSTKPKYTQSNPYFAGMPTIDFAAAQRNAFMFFGSTIAAGSSSQGWLFVYKSTDPTYNNSIGGLITVFGSGSQSFLTLTSPASAPPNGSAIANFDASGGGLGASINLGTHVETKAKLAAIQGNMLKYDAGGITAYTEAGLAGNSGTISVWPEAIIGLELGGNVSQLVVGHCSIAYAAAFDKRIPNDIMLQAIELAKERYGL